MSNLRAFDLAAAEAGEMPVTRDGKRKAIFAKQFKDKQGNDNILAVFADGVVDWYYPDGRYGEDRERSFDLMLPAKSVELWLNLYPHLGGGFYALSYPTQQCADGSAVTRIGPAMRVEFPL